MQDDDLAPRSEGATEAATSVYVVTSTLGQPLVPSYIQARIPLAEVHQGSCASCRHWLMGRHGGGASELLGRGEEGKDFSVKMVTKALTLVVLALVLTLVTAPDTEDGKDTALRTQRTQQSRYPHCLACLPRSVHACLCTRYRNPSKQNAMRATLISRVT